MASISRINVPDISNNTLNLDKLQKTLSTGKRLNQQNTPLSHSLPNMDKVDVNQRAEIYNTYAPPSLAESSRRYMPDNTDAAMRSIQREQDRIKELFNK